MSADTTEKTGRYASCETSCAECADDATFTDRDREVLGLRERVRLLEARCAEYRREREDARDMADVERRPADALFEQLRALKGGG